MQILSNAIKNLNSETKVKNTVPDEVKTHNLYFVPLKKLIWIIWMQDAEIKPATPCLAGQLHYPLSQLGPQSSPEIVEMKHKEKSFIF